MKKKIKYFLILCTILSFACGCGKQPVINNIDNNNSVEIPTPIVQEQASQEQMPLESTPTVELGEGIVVDVVGENTFNIENSNFFVEFIDVGQGDSILIGCDSEYMLIDGGEKSEYVNVSEALKEHNVETLTYLVATHPHSDHIGSLAQVIENYDVKDVLMPNNAPDTRICNNLLDAIEQKELEITIPTSGETYYLGEASIFILGPNSEKVFSDTNDYSIGMRIDYGDTSFYMAGDATKTEFDFMDYNVDIDVYKASHHGSKLTNSIEFLNATTPECVVISCGANNSYGHPNDEFLSRINGIPTYRTDIMGNITIYCDKEHYKVVTENGYGNIQLGSEICLTVSDIADNGNKDDDIVYVTQSGKKYHKSSCRYYSKDSEPLNLKDAETRGYEKCSICFKEGE